MVVGHTDSPITNWIYLFHMAVFFIASGFCWNEKNSLDFASLKRYIFRKIKSLYIPYVLCNGVYTLLGPLFVRWGLYSDEMLLSGKQIIIQIAKAFFFGGGIGFAGATWFLRTLFFVTIGHALLLFIIRRTRFKKHLQIIVLVLCTIAAQLIASFHISLPKGLSNCFAAYLAYFFGIWFKGNVVKSHFISKKYQKIAVLMGSAAILIVMNFTCSTNVNAIGNVLLYALASISGWLMLWELATLFIGARKLTSGLQKMFKTAGQNSIYIVILHFLTFKIVSIGYVLIAHKNFSLISAFPTIEGVPFLWIAYIPVGFFVPILIAMLVQKLKKHYRIWRAQA